MSTGLAEAAVISRAVSRRKAAALYDVGVDVIDKAIHSGALRARKVGGVVIDGELRHFRYRIHIDDLERWFAALPEV